MPIIEKLKSGLFPADKHHFIVIGLFAVLYLLWTNLVVGFRVDHFSFLFFLLCMLLAHQWTRTFTYSFVFFILFWIIYDSMRVYPNYLFNDVSIIEPYEIEKAIFGINVDDKIITPNEYFNTLNLPVLDFFSGLFYLSWVPVPLGLGIYLFFKDKKMLMQFSATYLFANLLGFFIYYIYPAAPPWYFAKYGVAELFNIQGSAAQLVRFDQLIGYPLFTNMYTKNSNVFAAVPSLHAAYPVITWYYARKKGLKWASLLIFVDIIGIWFAAVYSFHHYVIDVIMGLLCAVTAIFIFEKWIMKSGFSDILDDYLKFVHK
jgi:inositol phosphorylceramide synthase catalytic subunit